MKSSKNWKPITLDKLKKDNSNLWKVEKIGASLKEEMKKLNFKKVTPEQIGRLKNYVAVTEYGVERPHEDLDAQLDFKFFVERLPELDAEIFEMFLDNYSVKEIADEVERPVKTVYRRLNGVIEQYKQFYLEE